MLATPTAIMAAIGNATRHGFLVREGDALERLAQVRRVCFDKTGTLTTGEPQVVAVCAGEKDVSEDALLAVAGAADIALVNDDIAELPHLLRLARRMMTTIRINLTFSTTLNFIAIALAISGVLNPVVGALVHNAGSVLVIVNSALLLGWKPRVR
ncbi:hypothetical protein [Enorma massiliensis]|uniref:hypothetical protein n=1 Tax=Enorma massiliensis TaxID=1472761 RepID=UPI003A95414B